MVFRFDILQILKETPMYESSLTNEQWQVVERFFDKKKGIKGAGRPLKTSKRVILDAILYVTVAGIQWRMMPSDFPPWETVYYHFSKWKKDGTYRKVNNELSKLFRLRAGRPKTPTLGIIDSQSTKATDRAATRGYDGFKKVKGRKRHIIVDGLGNIIDMHVHNANIHDCKGAQMFLSSLKKLPFHLKKVIADKGYIGDIEDKFKNELKIDLEITGEEKNNTGFVVISKRWIVERTFAWFGKFRRLCRDYEVLSGSVVSFCYLAMIKLLINRLVVKEK